VKPFVSSTDLADSYTMLHMDSKTALFNGKFLLALPEQKACEAKFVKKISD